jgi:DNA repair exonuclease SbcCD ATPase subunit
LVDIVTILSILIPVITSIATLAYWLGRKFALIEERFERIDERFEKIEERFEKIEERFGKIDERFEKINERFKEMDERFERVEERIEKLERGFSSFRDVFIQYNETLLSLLEARGVLSKGEVLALKGILSPLRPHPTSKYYTEEVARRLDELLAKDPEELTLSDIRELERIGDLIWLEGYESDRMDLREYGMKLKVYATLVKVVFIYPKLRRLREEGILGLRS